MRGRKNPFSLNSQALLNFVAYNKKVTRSQVRKNLTLNSPGQVAYGLDKLHKEGKVRRHRGKGGAFIYTFKHF
jgi:predicted HTH transcriptional regulator